MSEDNYKIRTLGDYQRSVERFEKINDGLILPDLRLIVRIDARRHISVPENGRWSDWDYPYAPEIAEALLATARKLMAMGLYVSLAVVHGDEISLLLDVCEGLNSRKRSILLSLVSSAGSVHFRENFPHPVIFHGVLSELPSERHVLDYFFWQRRCFLRNLLSQALFRLLSAKGMNPREIDDRVNPLSLDERVALAVESGYPFDEQPDWKKFGAAVWWEESDSVAQSEQPSYQLVQSRHLPSSDLEFLTFLRERLAGPSFLPDSVDSLIPYREMAPGPSQLDSPRAKTAKGPVQATHRGSTSKPAVGNSGVAHSSFLKKDRNGVFQAGPSVGPFRIGGRSQHSPGQHSPEKAPKAPAGTSVPTEKEAGTSNPSQGVGVRRAGNRGANTTIIKAK